MKSIRDFIEGKIRRSESGEVLRLDDRARPPDPDLGAFEATLTGPKGSMAFFELGLVLGSDTKVRYEDIEQAVMSPADAKGRVVDVVTRGGTIHRIDASEAGGEVVLATLRWIGHTRLRRKIA